MRLTSSSDRIDTGALMALEVKSQPGNDHFQASQPVTLARLRRIAKLAGVQSLATSSQHRASQTAMRRSAIQRWRLSHLKSNPMRPHPRGLAVQICP